MLLQSNADLPRFFRCSINDWVEVVSCKGETVPVSIALSQIAVLLAASAIYLPLTPPYFD